MKSGEAFVVRTLAQLGRSAGAALECVQNGATQGCLAGAGARWVRALRRADDRERKLARTIAVRCGAPLVSRSVLLSADGLGFAADAADCAEVGGAGADAAAVGACVARTYRCDAERLLATVAPRAGELLRLTGVANDVRASLCVPDLGGSAGRAAEGGAAVVRCGRGAQRAGARLAARLLLALTGCTRATLPCVGTRDQDPACVTQATALCDRAFGRIATARTAFGRALAVACGSGRVGFDALAAASGLDLAGLGRVCTDVGIDAPDTLTHYGLCAGRSHECIVEEMHATAIPRAAALLALVGRPLTSAFCPVATPTPTLTSSLTPSASSTGPSATPRPGETPIPSASATPSGTATPRPTPTATPVCGNGIAEDGEDCDGLDLNDFGCDDLCFDEPDPPGTLACRRDCTYDFSGCKGTDCEAF